MRNLTYHEKTLNLVDLHRVPPMKFFFRYFFNFFNFFSKITQKTPNKDMLVNFRFRSGFFDFKSKWPFFTLQGAVCVGGYGGMSLEEDLTEKTENIRVGRYGGISLKTRIIRKREKDTCGGIRWGQFQN